MQILKNKLSIFFNKFWPIALIIIAVFIFFYPVWINQLLPIPGDLIVGTYFPWLDYKWGNIVGVPVKNPITSDVVSVLYPLRILAIDILKTGNIPLWNNSMFAGYPLLANLQVAIFSPTIFLYFIFPKVWAWTGQVILQPFLSALLTYFLLRHFKLTKLSSVLGGLAYAFSGFNIIWLEWNAHSLVAAFIPLVLLFVDKIIIEKKLIYSLILSVVIAFQFFSGYPQLIIYTAISAVILLVFRKSLNLKVLGMLFLASVLTLLLIAIQLLPAIELLSVSQRVSELLSIDSVFLPFRNLISFLAPDYFGNHVTGNFWGVGNYTNNVGYTGIVTIILAITSSIYMFKKLEVKYFLSLLFIALLLALENPVSTFIWKSGLFGAGASSGTRVLVLANLSLACLSAFVIEMLVKEKKKISVLPSFLVLIVLLSIFLATYLLGNYSQFKIMQNNYMVGLRNLVQPFALAFFVWLILIIRNIFRRVKYIRLCSALAIIVLLIVELFRFGWKFTPFSKAEYIFPETPVITYLKSLPKPNRLLPGNVFPMNMWVPYGLESLAGYDAVYPKFMAKYIAVSNRGAAIAPPQGRYGGLELYTGKLTDIANGEYLLLKNTDTKSYYKNLIKDGEIINVFTDRSVSVYKKPSALPRAYLVTRWSVLSGENILGRLLNDGFDPSKEVVLEKQPRVNTSNQPNAGSVKYSSYLGSNSKLDVYSKNPALLFVSDAWYPGWHAYVDGKETEIFRADYAFRAIEIPEGAHSVMFIYNPKSVRIGSWISVSGLILLLILIIHEYKTRRSSGSSQSSSG